jgi:hypothetical protein
VPVGEQVGDHDHLVHDAMGVDDAMPGAECAPGEQHLVDGLGHLATVFGMLVGQHQFGGRGHRARLVAVHALHLLRPLPALVLEIKAKPSDALRRSGEGLVDLGWVAILLSSHCHTRRRSKCRTSWSRYR